MNKQADGNLSEMNQFCYKWHRHMMEQDFNNIEFL